MTITLPSFRPDATYVNASAIRSKGYFRSIKGRKRPRSIESRTNPKSDATSLGGMKGLSSRPAMA